MLHKTYDVARNPYFANKACQIENGVSFFSPKGINIGKKWYTDGSKQILLGLNDQIPENYRLGVRDEYSAIVSERTKDSIWVRNAIENKMVQPGELDWYLENG